MRLLIPVFSPATGTWGGLTRVLAVADAATAAGDAVAFCAAGALAGPLRGRGYRVYETPAPSMLGLPKALSRVLEARSQRVSLPVPPGRSIGSIWLVLLVSGYAGAGYLRRLVDAQRAAARDFEPDALFTDLDPGAFVLARIEGLPLAATYASVLEQGKGTWPWSRFGEAVASVLRAHGREPVDPHGLYFAPDVLKLVPSIPELDGADPARPDIRYVGHLLGAIRTAEAGAFTPEPGRRYVFAYLGTGSVSLDRARAVLPQAFPATSPLECLVGAQSLTRPEQIGRVRFLPYVPAEAVLPACDWVLCHGGLNTIIQALAHGVPLLLFPGPIFERRLNAERVQAHGSGFMGESSDFTPAWLTGRLGEQTRCAAGAQALGARIMSLGGATAAVEAIRRHAGRYERIAAINPTRGPVAV